MSVHWHSQVRQVRIKSLRLGGGFSRRLGAPHVEALAKSKDEIGAINLPAVCWKLGKEKRLEVAAGEDRIAAELVRNGGKWDALIEVRAFDADEPEDIAKVRAHENAHRRHDDRDAWLRGLVSRELEDSAESEPRVGAIVAAPGEDGREADGGDAQPGDASGSPAPVAHAPDWEGNPACGREWKTGESVIGEIMLAKGKKVTCPACVALDAPAAEEEPLKHKWFALDRKNVHQTACGDAGERVGAWEQVTCPKCLAKQQEWGSDGPPRPSKADKAEARRRVAEREKTTPAAVKQAEHRDRRRTGEAKRTKHDDTAGPELSAEQLQIQRALIDIDADISRALVRAKNLLEKRPDLRLEPWHLEQRIEQLSAWAKGLAAVRKDQWL